MLAALIVNIVSIASVLGGAAASMSFVRPTEIFEPPIRGNGMIASWLPLHVLPVTGGASHISSDDLLHQILALVIATIMSMVAAAVIVHPVVPRVYLWVYSTRLSSTHGCLCRVLTTPMNRSIAIYRQLQEILWSHALSEKLKASFRPPPLVVVVLNHYHCY